MFHKLAKCVTQNGFKRFVGKTYATATAKLVDVIVNEKSGAATVTMQHPKINVLTLEFLQDLSRTLDYIERNKCRGMILTSACPKVFSAGLDFKELINPEEDRLKFYVNTYYSVWLKIYKSPFPTVAAINGAAPAGGCLLAVGCEYRVMVSGYKIGLIESQIGIVMPIWVHDIMKTIIPVRQSELAISTGKLFTTDEALQIGLVDEVASDEEDALARSEKFLARFSRILPDVSSRSKAVFRSIEITAFEENKETNVAITLANVLNPQTQKMLHKYAASLKKT